MADCRPGLRTIKAKNTVNVKFILVFLSLGLVISWFFPVVAFSIMDYSMAIDAHDDTEVHVIYEGSDIRVPYGQCTKTLVAAAFKV